VFWLLASATVHNNHAWSVYGCSRCNLYYLYLTVMSSLFIAWLRRLVVLWLLLVTCCW